MTKTFSAPSDEFPAAPAVTLVAPDDWSAGPSAPTLLAVLGPERDQSFRPNVVVSADRLPVAADLEELADGVRTRVAQLPGSSVVLDRVVSVGGRQAHLVQYTYRHDEAGTLAQSLLTIPVEHQGVTDLVEVVGSIGGDRVDQDTEVMTRVMQSVTIS